MTTGRFLRPDSALSEVGEPNQGTKFAVEPGRLVMVDNGKPNAGAYLALLEQELRPRLPTTEISRVRKSSAGEAIAPDLLDRVEGADVAITGFADCGSCSSWTVRDAVLMTRRNVRTAVIVTEPFLPLAQMVGRNLGMPGNVFVVLPHPVGTLDHLQLSKLAGRSLSRVIDVLGIKAGADANEQS